MSASVDAHDLASQTPSLSYTRLDYVIAHTHTTLTPAKIEKNTRQTPYV